MQREKIICRGFKKIRKIKTCFFQNMCYTFNTKLKGFNYEQFNKIILE